MAVMIAQMLAWHHPPIRLSINPKLSLKSNNSSFCTSLLFSRFNALQFMQFYDIHLLFFGHRVPCCHGVLFSLYLSHKSCHFMLHLLSPSHRNTHGLHSVNLLCDISAKINHSCIKNLVILLWWGINIIAFGLGLSAFYTLEKVVDIAI